MKIEMKHASVDDMGVCARILNDWIDATTWMPRVHSHEDVADHYRNVVFRGRTVIVGNRSGHISGFVVVDDQQKFVTALYVEGSSRGQGIGGHLIETAKSHLADEVNLWTFVANEPAQKFYKKHGFSEVRRTDGDNEEHLPDILMRWFARSGSDEE
jgi:ribosomal protein S18 acetylase RimI-like enzyme